MKKVFITLCLGLMAQSSFALTSFVCNAQMLGKTQLAPKSFSAPALVGQGLNSLLRAKHNTDHIFLNFNSQTVSESKAHVILDGRYKSILMNTHMSVSERNNIITITLRDTVTHKTETTEFNMGSNIAISFDNGSAHFGLDCIAF